MNDKNNTSDRTLAYYDTNAQVISARYEVALPLEPLRLLEAMLCPGDKVLELGCGSGRDGAFLLNKGYDWIGVEGSPAMAAQAISLHPMLSGRISIADFRKPLAFAQRSFDGIFSFAALMHLDASDVLTVLSHMYLLLKPNSFFMISVPVSRIDVGGDGFDAEGRYFLSWGGREWSEALAKANFIVENISNNKDCLERDIVWLNISARKREDTTEQ